MSDGFDRGDNQGCTLADLQRMMEEYDGEVPDLWDSDTTLSGDVL